MQGLRGGAHGGEDRVVVAAGELDGDRLLRGELEVDGADADASLTGDVRHGGLGGAVVAKQALGCVEDLGAAKTVHGEPMTKVFNPRIRRLASACDLVLCEG